MGCAASREKLDKCDIASAKGSMTPEQCVARVSTKNQTAFLLREKFLSWGGDFEIKNETGAACL